MIEAAKAEVMAVRETDHQVNKARPIHTMPRSGGPVQRQSTFDWKMANKYQELFNFKIEVNNIFMMNNCSTQEIERVPIILNWLGWEGLRFVQTLNDEEQEKCRTSTGLFKVTNAATSKQVLAWARRGEAQKLRKH